ncbi:UDP-galactose transporter Gms1 [Coemansia sp. RSA 552]|nr:UDP-galactose transporter Gms1 [Coemansia sp. RSA 552]
MAGDPKVFGVPLKYVSLVVLTVQNSLLVLVMRYSRVSSTTMYYTSTAVLLSELSKFLVCFYIAARASVSESGRFVPRDILRDILGGDSVKMFIPAGLYTIQNNLQYAAVSLLDAATFQVTYQLKILTTALCAVLMLGTQLSRARWFALVTLTLGIILVQLPSETVADNGVSSPQKMLGLLAVFTACCLSGLAGVYFEKVLKGSRKSIWVRNVQLSLFSMVPALFGVLAVDGQGVRQNGFFYGYTRWTYAAIACQAGGGLIVAVVVKYADNILKGFATSISIILSCLASVWLFDFHISPAFICGTSLVIYATYSYGKPDAAQRQPVQQEPVLPSVATPSKDSDYGVATDQLDDENIQLSTIESSTATTTTTKTL